MSVKKSVILKDSHIFVVKLNLEAGDVIPEHHSTAHVTATVISGGGIFTVEGKENALEPGVFISMLPYEKHSIKANSALEIIVHHIVLPKNETKEHSEKMCGLSS